MQKYIRTKKLKQGRFCLIVGRVKNNDTQDYQLVAFIWISYLPRDFSHYW